MKKLTFVGIILTLAVLAAIAPAFAADLSGGVYAGVYDKYLWRGFDLSGGQPVAQGGLDLSLGGATLSYWGNLQLSDADAEGLNAGEATEHDIILDYTFDVNDLVSVSLGNIYYSLDGIEDTNEAYLSVSFNTLLEPAVTAYYDWDEADEDGLYYTASIGHTFALSEAASLSLGALAGYNQQSDYAVGDYTGWHNYELSAAIDYAVTEQITITPSLLYSSGISDDAKDLIDSEAVGGVSVAVSF